MNILGLNYFYHDSTACIVKNGELVAAVEQERLSRVKHSDAFPNQAIQQCLQLAELNSADIDHIAISVNPTLNWAAKLLYGLRHPRHIKPFLRHELIRARYQQQAFWAWCTAHYPNPKQCPQIHFIPHHLSHVVGSFYVSPYENAALLGLDGAGEWATSFLGKGENLSVECLQQSYFPMSLGSFYEAATEFCGFRPNYDEGKTMGLAPLGDSQRFYKQVKSLLKIDKSGKIQIDLSYFAYQYWGKQRCGQKFYQTFGQPRQHGQAFEPHHLDVAAAFQLVLEEAILSLSHILQQQTQANYLVLSGGVALNSVANGRVVAETDFADIYVMPAAGDNGTAIGAAYYLYHHELRQNRCFVHNSPYLGKHYSDADIATVLAESKLKATYHADITSVAATYLHQGNIIAWFQGKMEIGPRALGNRSILADPTQAHMKDKINAEVKHREAFRPFAPSVIVEAKNDYFDLAVEAPFMLKVCAVKPDKQAVLPAITHVDGSARLQTVDKKINPLYHRLISDFGKLSGVPVVLNTSFNVMGEPIVESPQDAIRCFYSTGIDVLILGHYVLEK